ncbi:hypothetical protein CFC21_013883 [Triticum aestivum]|uniref:Uncharacterized protein n=3 Tax=Triticinae TaxID=1648030 RepID=A0A3B6A191_WHEAT|nr:uncharacterized protein LOC109761936 [Aegilops tauschii subsp. strangulata]XP_044446943.1 uncharacterized protein LOC123177037 [Triticum aestivum]KAF6997679.1 hypothetical protein CFC21_013883 [Triticum aestivum]
MIGGAGRQRQRHDGAVARPRRRFEVAGGEEEGGEATTASAGCMCRSCAAVAVADCVALACCPCAVVSLLGLALVRAPLAVGRLLIRARRRRRALLRGKRVRYVAAPAAPAPSDNGGIHDKVAEKVEGIRGGVDTTSTTADGELGGVDDHEAELAWLEEMYRTGRWGFGRVSFSAKTP